MARLIAWARLGASGWFAAGPHGVTFTPWVEPGVLRARMLFEEPYPKFGRMDPLCKAAVAAVRLMERAGGLRGVDRDNLAQYGGTVHGCIAVDSQFEATRRAGAPSPALFVYTLPSMFQGEVAIHWRLRGPCTLFTGLEDAGARALQSALRDVRAGRVPAALVIAADAAPAPEAAAWLIAPGPAGLCEL